MISPPSNACAQKAISSTASGQSSPRKLVPLKPPKQRRRIAVVGAGPVGLWAATLLMKRHARRLRRAAGTRHPAFSRSADAPEIVIFERRLLDEHCAGRNRRIFLDDRAIALLNK